MVVGPFDNYLKLCIVCNVKSTFHDEFMVAKITMQLCLTSLKFEFELSFVVVLVLK